MSNKEQIEFIRKNQNLSPEVLSSRTGLNRHRVIKILAQLSHESRQEPAATKALNTADYRLFWLIAFIPAILAFLSYLPVLQNHFVNWDDDSAIMDNIHLHFFNWNSLKWMFTTFYTGNWIPLNWLSLSLDYHLGGLNPLVYHLHNLLLHILNTLLVFFLSLKVFTAAQNSGFPQGRETPAAVFLTASFFSALLFGIHPIHVESVAWATERKDLLCSAFFLSSLLMYMDYGSSAVRKAWKRYVCFGLFLLALMSKPMAITLPFILLLLDIWPLAGFSRNRAGILLEKIPFFTASFFSAWLTLSAQSNAIELWTMEKLPPDFRIMNAFHSIMFYLVKMLMPVHLSVIYPIPAGHAAFSLINIISCFLVLLISAICLRYYKSRPYIAAAWLYYIIMLAPVLGIIQVGYQTAADRYSYLPCLGPLLLLAAVPASLFSGRKLPAAILGLILACCLGLKTAAQAHVWHDSISLWENAARFYPNESLTIHTDLGNAYKDAGRLDEAIIEYNKAIGIGPPDETPHNGLATALAAKGLTQDAIKELKTAISLDPMMAPLHYNLSVLYSRSGQYDDSLFEIQEAVRIKPKNPVFLLTLGNAYMLKGMYPEAVAALEKAAELQPQNPEIYQKLEEAKQKAGTKQH